LTMFSHRTSKRERSLKKPNKTIDDQPERLLYIDLQREMLRRMLRYSKGIERAAIGQQNTIKSWMSAIESRDSGPDDGHS
jgi:hypothetical protein